MLMEIILQMVWRRIHHVTRMEEGYEGIEGVKENGYTDLVE